VRVRECVGAGAGACVRVCVCACAGLRGDEEDEACGEGVVGLGVEEVVGAGEGVEGYEQARGGDAHNVGHQQRPPVVVLRAVHNLHASLVSLGNCDNE
jgi:hypothetical protein